MTDIANGVTLRSYLGNCHCGIFKFEVTVPRIVSVQEDDCSLCTKKGYRWIFPEDGGLVIEKGADSLTKYEFGQKTMTHTVCYLTLLLVEISRLLAPQFCSICGTPIYCQRKKIIRESIQITGEYAVNVSSLHFQHISTLY